MRAAGAEPPRGRHAQGPVRGRAAAPGDRVPGRDTSTRLGGRAAEESVRLLLWAPDQGEGPPLLPLSEV